MKKFKKNDLDWYCGFWNKTKLSIYLHSNKNKLYSKEKLHYHPDFCEYYLVIEGQLIMIIDGEEIAIDKNQLLMIEPKEVHRVLKFGLHGCIYVVVKEKSYPNSTIPVK